MNHIFISYSRKDSEYVNAVTALLREAGLSVWQDISGKGSGIPFSTKWFSAIEEALHTSAGAVVFDSEYWQNSIPCRKEHDIVKQLHIPCHTVNVSQALPAEDAARAITAWANTEVYGPEENELRTWLLSSLNAQRTSRSLNTGIPHCKDKAEAQQFLQRLEAAGNLAKTYHFDTEQPKLYKEVERFIQKAKRITLWDRIKKPLALAAAALLILGIVLANVLYSKERTRTNQHLEALRSLDTIHSALEASETKALELMVNDSSNYGDYIYLLFENYADALDSVFPCEFYQAGSKEAEAVTMTEEQMYTEKYEPVTSGTSGNVKILKESGIEGVPNEATAFTVACPPESMAMHERFLALAAGQKVYVIDMASGRDAVQLSGSYRHIEKVRFDDKGRICAVTDAGDVYVWDNPIEAIILENAPNCVMFEQYESADGRFLVSYEPDGTVYVKDRGNDGIIFQCSLIREPLKGIFMEDASNLILVQGMSDTYYRIDASSVLKDYSNDSTVQKANYDALAEALLGHVCDDLQIIRRTQQ